MPKQILSDTVKFMRIIQGNVVDWGKGGGEPKREGKGRITSTLTSELGSNLPKWSN